jgi:hypothetical protein
MIENLRSAFKDLLLEADWMEQVTRNAALVKADAIAGLMAYPDWLEESDGLEKYYNGVMCVSYQFSQNFENSLKLLKKYQLELAIGEDAHFQNTLNIAKWSLNKSFVSLRVPNTEEE